jgi:hypothetical protein
MNKDKLTFYLSEELCRKLEYNWCEIKTERVRWLCSDKKKYIINRNIVLYWWWNIKLLSTAYHILEDICCKYPKEFFWDTLWYKWICNEILWYMIMWDKDKAEKFFWKNCVFNK